MRQMACFSKNPCEDIWMYCLARKDRQRSYYTKCPKYIAPMQHIIQE